MPLEQRSIRESSSLTRGGQQDSLCQFLEGYLFATQLAGIVIVQPLMNVGLIALVILSSRRLGEAIDLQAMIGIILLVLTPVFIAFGGVTEPTVFNDYLAITVFSALLLLGIAVMIPASKRVPILWAMVHTLAIRRF